MACNGRDDDERDATLRAYIATPPAEAARVMLPDVQHVYLTGPGRFVTMVARSTQLPEVWLVRLRGRFAPCFDVSTGNVTSGTSKS